MMRGRFQSMRGRAWRLAALLLSCGLFAYAQSAPDPGRLGFEPGAKLGISSIGGKDLEGSDRSLDLAGDRLIVLHYFRPGQGQPRAALAALERLRADYGGRVIVAALSAAPYGSLAAALMGEELRYPILSNRRGAELLGLPDRSSYLLIAPGGSPVARRVGAFDWGAPEARKLLDDILARAEAAKAAQPAQPASTAAGAPAAAPTAAAPAAPSAAPTIVPTVAQAAAAPPSSYLSALEAGVVEELNLARTDPKAYAAILRKYRSLIRDGVYERPGQIGISLQEGTRAVDEAISFLERQKALQPLVPAKGISAAARAHASDQRGGATGHSGSDGSSPFVRMNRYGSWSGTAGENVAYGPDEAREIVIQLIVDDGVPSRGHRTNIYNAAFARVGAGTGPHAKYGTVCVLDFAAAYQEK